MADEIVFPSREFRGRKRFPTNAEFLKSLRFRVETSAQNMVENLPSNYPDTDKGEIGAIFKAFAQEAELLSRASSDIREDSVFTQTRAEFLFQVLGDLLFLGEKAIGPLDPQGNSILTDVEYRDFLLKVKKGYLGGSTTSNIEDTLSDILGIPVILKELYLEARKKNSIYGLKDTHKLVFDIFMDDIESPTGYLGKLLQDLLFFIDLIKPAHKLFKTRLVWRDEFTINHCLTDVFAASDEGVLISYDYTPSVEQVYSLKKLSLYVGEEDSDIVEDSWLSGTVDATNTVNGTITLESGIILAVSSVSLFYNKDDQGDFRIDFEDIVSGDEVKYHGLLAPGEFQFYNTPQDIIDNKYLQYDPLYIQTPIFQENVIKVYDDNGRFEVSVGLCDTTIVEKKVVDNLIPEYEDLRDSCCYPSPKPVSAKFDTVTLTPIEKGDGAYNLPAYLNPTDEGNVFIASPTPMLNSEGELATVDDLVLIINGKTVLDSIESVDPITGEITFNFVPPSNVEVRVDYYCADRFPTPDSYETEINCGSTPPEENDLAACLTPVDEDAIIRRLKWPFNVSDPASYGDELDYQVDKFPILEQLGNLACPEDIKVFVDDVEVPDAVVSARPLLGHIRVGFLPPSGSTLRFEYYTYTKCKTYALIPDDLGYISDAVQGSRVLYSLIPDVAPGDEKEFVAPFDSIKEIEYRYRAFNLSNSSVLNSRDTFELNGYGKPAIKASYTTSYSKLNDFSLMFSPEHLTDTNKYVELDDDYLQNELTANLILRDGIPPFVRTFTDDGKYRGLDTVVESESTYQEDVEGSMDLSASLNIVSWYEQDGFIEHSPLPDFREDHSLLLYSDLKEFTKESGEDVHLSTICDDGSGSMAFSLSMEEEYYPSRELRLNDYLDFVDRVETIVVADGELRTLKGTDLVKSLGVNWNHVGRGDTLAIGEYTFTVLDVINSDTLKIHQPFSGASGRYDYAITSEEAPEVRVMLNEVVRKLNLGLTGTYSFYSDAYVNQAGSTGYSPWNQTVNFPDPDPDPYPRNPDNPELYGATGPLLLDSEIEEEGGEVDHLLDDEESEKMVKWRNWDQDHINSSFGLLQEEITNAVDDLADDISVLFWNVSNQEFVKHVYSGTVIETSMLQGVVDAADYPNGLIRLVDAFDSDKLDEAQYSLKNTVVRQILPDNSVEISALQELVRI